MLKVIQCFDKHCSCHLESECVLFRHFLEALKRACRGWQVGHYELDWWSGRAGCCPIGDEYVVEKKR
jgi:hypothetical protein